MARKKTAHKNGAHHQKNDAQKTAAKMGTPKIRDRKMARQKWRTKNDAPKMAHEIEGLLMGHITKNLARQKKKDNNKGGKKFFFR